MGKQINFYLKRDYLFLTGSLLLVKALNNAELKNRGFVRWLDVLEKSMVAFIYTLSREFLQPEGADQRVGDNVG